MADFNVGDRVRHHDNNTPGTVIQRGLRVQFDDGECLDVNADDIEHMPPMIAADKIEALRRALTPTQDVSSMQYLTAWNAAIERVLMLAEVSR